MSTTLKVLKGKGAKAVRCAMESCKKRIPAEIAERAAVQIEDAYLCTTCVAAILEAVKPWYEKNK